MRPAQHHLPSFRRLICSPPLTSSPYISPTTVARPSSRCCTIQRRSCLRLVAPGDPTIFSPKHSHHIVFPNIIFVSPQSILCFIHRSTTHRRLPQLWPKPTLHRRHVFPSELQFDSSPWSILSSLRIIEARTHPIFILYCL